MRMTNTIICNSRPNCPCQFCGQVRLLFEQERQRYVAEMDPSCIPSPEKVRAALERTGQWESTQRRKAEIDALALDYIAELERRKPQ